MLISLQDLSLLPITCGCHFAPCEVDLRGTPFIFCPTAVSARTPGPPTSVARSPCLVSHQGVGPCQGSPTLGRQNCLSGSRGCHTCLAP